MSDKNKVISIILMISLGTGISSAVSGSPDLQLTSLGYFLVALFVKVAV